MYINFHFLNMFHTEHLLNECLQKGNHMKIPLITINNRLFESVVLDWGGGQVAGKKIMSGLHLRNHVGC